MYCNNDYNSCIDIADINIDQYSKESKFCDPRARGENLTVEASLINLPHMEVAIISASLSKIHPTTYYSTAKKTANVPFLDHQILECDRAGREYTNVDHDITLRIPEGAVAEGEKIHFEVGVAMYGPFMFPENTQVGNPSHQSYGYVFLKEMLN